MSEGLMETPISTVLLFIPGLVRFIWTAPSFVYQSYIFQPDNAETHTVVLLTNGRTVEVGTETYKMTDSLGALEKTAKEDRYHLLSSEMDMVDIVLWKSHPLFSVRWVYIHKPTWGCLWSGALRGFALGNDSVRKMDLALLFVEASQSSET